ncbi:MAG TPA: Uma2 family endonuclease [Blastocatellia bacterium]|nr:Uma2 family endonuclease [Blastocatellia bacterium]
MATNRKNVPPHYYTLEEYFALEGASDARFEYWNGDIVCMSGGTRAHLQISDNVFFNLRLNLRGRQCQAFTANVAIKTPTLPPYRYPDAAVVCGEPKFEKMHGVDVLTNPILIVEVMSPSTAGDDQGQKFTAYQTIPTFMEYLLIEQNSVRVIHYKRESPGKWSREDITDINASVMLSSTDCSLNLSEIYENVALSGS